MIAKSFVDRVREDKKAEKEPNTESQRRQLIIACTKIPLKQILVHAITHRVRAIIEASGSSLVVVGGVCSPLAVRHEDLTCQLGVSWAVSKSCLSVGRFSKSCLITPTQNNTMVPTTIHNTTKHTTNPAMIKLRRRETTPAAAQQYQRR